MRIYRDTLPSPDRELTIERIFSIKKTLNMQNDPAYRVTNPAGIDPRSYILHEESCNI